MPYMFFANTLLEFTPPSENVPARLEIAVKDEAAVLQEKRALIRETARLALRKVEDDEGTTPAQMQADMRSLMDTTVAIADADPSDLPIYAVLPALEAGEDIPVIHKPTAQVLVDWETDKPDYVLLTESMDEEKLDWYTNDPEFARRVIKDDFNCLGYAYQPTCENGIWGAIGHYSLGYTIEGGGYQPVITVLDVSHPVRQQITAMAEAA